MAGLFFQHHVDVLGIVGVLITLATVSGYIYLLKTHYRHLDESRDMAHVQRLALRMAMLFPWYSVCYCLMLLMPNTYVIWEVVAAFMEGYVCYTFFAMLIVFVGGQQKAVEIFNTSESGCCPCASCRKGSVADAERCYHRLRLGTKQIMFMQPLLNLGTAVFESVGHAEASDACKGLQAVSVAVGLLCIVNEYFILLPKLEGLNAFSKIVMIKVFVVFIFVQSIVLDGLYAAGVFSGSIGLSRYNARQKERRALGFVIIVELAIMLLVVWRAYDYAQFTEQRRGSQSVNLELEDDESGAFKERQGQKTFREFVHEIFQFQYLFRDTPANEHQALLSDSHLPGAPVVPESQGGSDF